MFLSILALFLFSATCISSQIVLAPQLEIVNITYYGSACPEGHQLNATIGALHTTTNTAPLTFTLSDFVPALGSADFALRMCDIIAYLSISPGWKLSVNARGSQARGPLNLNTNSSVGMRGTYQFADNAEAQSVGLLYVDGPHTGHFDKSLQPSMDGDRGVTGPCTGGELDIEFQSMTTQDLNPLVKMPVKASVDDTAWTLSTDIDVSQC